MEQQKNLTITYYVRNVRFDDDGGGVHIIVGSLPPGEKDSTEEHESYYMVEDSKKLTPEEMLTCAETRAVARFIKKITWLKLFGNLNHYEN